MVVLLPVLEGERTKACPRCGAVGLCSPLRPRTTFYVRRGGGYRSECRRCTTALTTEAQARRRARDPEGAARRRREAQERFAELHPERRAASCRRYVERKKAEDPEAFARAAAERQRRYQAKLRKDPARREAARERDRINRRLRKEQKEGKVTEVAQVPKNAASGVRLPIGPFRDWLLGLGEEEVARDPDLRDRDPQTVRKAIAARVGVAPRTVHRYLHEWEEIDESIVDARVCYEGRLSLYDLYPAQLDYEPAQGELPLEVAA